MLLPNLHEVNVNICKAIGTLYTCLNLDYFCLMTELLDCINILRKGIKTYKDIDFALKVLDLGA